MDPSLHRWVSASRADLGARLAVVAFAAIGHYAFLTSVLWDSESGAWFPLVAALPNALVIAAVALARPDTVWLCRGPALPTVVASALAFAVAPLIGRHPFGPNLFYFQGTVADECVSFAFVGAFGGLMGATVTVPLSRAVSRWRADPAPRRALDVWATLACLAAVFAVTRPSLFEHRLLGWESPFYTPLPCHNLALARALGPLDLALTALALVIAVAVVAFDLSLRRTIARAHAGALGGRPTTGPGALAAEGVSLATMHDEEMVALVRPPGEAAYRASATEAVLAQLPRAPRVSWRLGAMPWVALACALRLAVEAAARMR